MLEFHPQKMNTCSQKQDWTEHKTEQKTLKNQKNNHHSPTTNPNKTRAMHTTKFQQPYKTSC